MGSDISVTRVEAEDRGEVFFNSADDIFAADDIFGLLADDLFVTGEFLSAVANNNAINAFDGVILTTDVDEFFISQPNGGELFVNEA